MDSYVTIEIEYDRYEQLMVLLSRLSDLNYKFWFMHKQGKLRLRVLDMYADEIEEKIRGYSLNAKRTLYEPEVFLFGGAESINCVHELFCDIARISIRIKQLSTMNPNQQGLNICLCLHSINKMLSYCRFDNFEEWDVWNKVCEHRQIDVTKFSKILLSKLYDVHCAINDTQFDLTLCDAEQTVFIFNDIKRQCEFLVALSHSTQLTRGVRSILSSVIIFSLNMMNIPAQKQCGFVHIMRILTNPDFRRELGL